MANEIDQSLTPATIPDVPIPLISTNTPNQSSVLAAASISNPDSGSLQPATIPNTPYTTPVTAGDVISASIDTARRQILGQYTFGQVGSLAIGQFQQGKSGDVRISPNGIIARNNQGLDYFTLDETGLAITDGKDATIIDSTGIRSTSQFQHFTISDGTTYTTASTSYVNIPGASWTQTITNRAVWIEYTITVYILNNAFISNAYLCDVQLYDSFLGGPAVGTLTSGGNAATYVTFPSPGVTSVSTNIVSQAVTFVAFITAAVGVHNLSLQFKARGGGTSYIDAYTIQLMTLGT